MMQVHTQETYLASIKDAQHWMPGDVGVGWGQEGNWRGCWRGCWREADHGANP